MKKSDQFVPLWKQALERYDSRKVQPKEESLAYIQRRVNEKRLEQLNGMELRKGTDDELILEKRKLERILR